LTQELIYVLEALLSKLLEQLSSIKTQNKDLIEELTNTKQEAILATNKFHNVETKLIQKQQEIES
jgi:cellobiose-specific phosphotransferase system component IIA